MKRFNITSGICLLLLCNSLKAQDKDLKYSLNDDGSHYIKATITSQVWLQSIEANPGTTVGGKEVSQINAIGIRRMRSQLFGQVTDKVFFYTQFGINNWSNYANNGAANTPPGLFFHDVMGEYQVTKQSLHIGTGLTAWNGFARYSAPAVATIMGLDAPLFEQTTNNVTDNFLRKFSIYAKGKLGKLDYRIVFSDPILMTSTDGATSSTTIQSNFATTAPKLQSSGYFSYQFLDQENNITGYNVGTYLGKKKVFNIGAGYQYQPDATWNKDGYHDMKNFAVDIFYDTPLAHNGSAISFYGAFASTNYGPNYLKGLGGLNPVSGNTTSYGGAYQTPGYGTGKVLYGQLGYLLPEKTLGAKNGQLMLYTVYSRSDYDMITSPANVYNVGINWLIDAHKAKLTLDYQNRPYYNSVGSVPSPISSQGRKGAFTIQFQIAI